MTRSAAGCLCVVLLGLSAPALAHHSAAGIDRTKSQVVTGTVKEFRWTNPHSWIDLDVTDDKGVAQTWSVEMTSPAFLVRAGWKSSTLKPVACSVSERLLRRRSPDFRDRRPCAAGLKTRRYSS